MKPSELDRDWKVSGSHPSE